MNQEVGWDLTHLFADERDFWAVFGQVAEKAQLGFQWQQRPLATVEDLRGALAEYFDTLRHYGRLAVYAFTSSDEDTRDTNRWARRVQTQDLGAKISAAWSWLLPRLAHLDAHWVEGLLASTADLADYSFFLRDALRQRPHLLASGEEKVLAELSAVARAPYNLYQVLTHADFPFPEISLPTGETVRIDQTAYTRLREHPDRGVRERVARQFFRTYQGFARTLACNLDAQVRHGVVEARLRGFPSALAASLFPHAVPEQVYHRLLAEAEGLMPLLYDLLRLRQVALGLEKLAFFDLYVPWGESCLAEVGLHQAQELLLAALAPLGEEYGAILQEGFRGGWMDPYPRPGKRSGAYCTGDAYDVHPYILLNFHGNLDGVCTMAHEWGHAVHSALANRHQPYPTAEYPIFIAEVASTMNETLLLQHLLQQASTPAMRLFILSHLLEHFRGTFFRQANFADFELEVYRRVEAGEALTADLLTDLYGQRQRRWLGHEAGVVEVEEEFAVEWGYIPHFYYGFYVYQYATSLVASTFFARQLTAGEPQAQERFLRLLKAGGSAYPYQLLCEAGVDLASPEPYRELGVYLSGLLDQARQLVTEAQVNESLPRS
ncbi:MAG: oligoendopeptidase F [Thermoanaerobaculum sp.]|nr:oligoendopeptidase F [Thermoanaerobaculum sp.]MDW7967058.1 oligoendopeptidase F [Thermoanaerobaculum sp.]